MKKCISIIVCIVMIFTCIPALAFADEEVVDVENSEEGVSIVNQGTCGDELTWELDSAGTLSISGRGDMKEYFPHTGFPWYTYRETITNVIINSGVSGVSPIAFIGYKNIETISLPETLNSIGYSAFSGCEKLVSVSIPSGVSSIGNNAFTECYNLESIIIPDSVISIDYDVFHACEKLTIIGSPNSEIYKYAISNCIKFECIEHDWEDGYTVDKEATCTEEGSKSIHCKDCEATKDVTVIEKHNYSEWITDKEATCKENGSRRKVCSDCGEVFYEDIISQGHDWEDYDVYEDATCTQDGYKSIKCKSCDEIIEDIVIERTGHSFGDWASDDYNNTSTGVAANCKYKTCSSCGHIVTEKDVDLQLARIKYYTGTIEKQNCKYWDIWLEGTNDNIMLPFEVDMKEVYLQYMDAKGDMVEKQLDVSDEETEIIINSISADGSNKESYALKLSIESVPTDPYRMFVVYDTGMMGDAIEFNFNSNDVANVYLPESVDATSITSVDGYDVGGDKIHVPFTLDAHGTATIDIESSNGKTYTVNVYVEGKDTYECVYSDWIIAKEATSTEKGAKYRKCIACGNEETLEIYYIPHDVEVVESGTCGDDLTWEITKNRELIIRGSGSMKNYNGWVSGGSSHVSTPWFKYAERIENVYIEEGVISIGDYAFAYLNNVKGEITIPNTVESLGYNSFLYCSCSGTIYVNENMTGLDWTFLHCPNIERFQVDQKNPKYSSDESGVLYNKTRSSIICYPSGNMNSVYCIPQSVTNIEWHAFDNCDNLKEFAIEEGNQSFSVDDRGVLFDKEFKKIIRCAGNSTITEYSLPATTAIIGDWAFQDCESLEQIDLNEGMAIMNSAFRNCINLKQIEIRGDASLFTKCFMGCKNLEEVTISTSAYSGRLPDENFKGCTNIKKLTITGNGILYSAVDNGSSVCAWFDSRNSIDTIIIEEGVKGIGEGALSNLRNVKDIKLPNSLTTLEENALQGCGSLREITLPINLTVLGDDAIPSGIKTIWLECDPPLIVSNALGTYSATIYYPCNNELWSESERLQWNSNATWIKNHNFKFAEEKDSTCANEGLIINKCTICDEESQEIIPVKEHTFGEYVVTKKATFTEDGIGSYKCENCTDKKEEIINKVSSVSLSTTVYTYNGSNKTPSVTVKDSSGKALIAGKDYKVTYGSSSRKSIGRYSVNVTLLGEYSGVKTLYFTIGPKNPSSVKAALYGYDDIKVSWKKVSGASGYTVYYKPSTSSKWSSKTTTGKSTKLANLADGVKYDIKVTTYKTKGGYRCYNAGKTTSTYTLKKVSGVSVKKSGSKVRVYWTNISGESGYQISKATKRNKTSVVSTYKTTSGKSKTISAKKGKTYYYKVRAYKTVSGKKIYGPWSTVIKYKR